MNFVELTQSIQDKLVEDENINKFLDDKMEEEYPGLNKDESEDWELTYYALRNELFMRVMLKVLNNMSPEL